VNFYTKNDILLPQNLSDQYIKKVERSRMKINHKLNLMAQISLLFQNNNIEHIFIKGEVLSKFIFDCYYQRVSSDIDILILKEDFLKANELLLEKGYKSTLNEHYQDIFHLNSHEVPYLCEGVCVELKFLTSSISDPDILQTMFLDTKELIINEVIIKTFNFENTLISLISNLYSNIENAYSSVCLRDILDLYFLIKYNFDKINLSNIFILSEEYKLTHKMHSVLTEMNILFDSELLLNVDLFSSLNSNYNWSAVGAFQNGWLVAKFIKNKTKAKKY